MSHNRSDILNTPSYQCALSLVYNGVPETITSTITVDQSGKGNFTKVQDAINFIPANNSHWIRVHIRVGIYNEKVIIPREKPFIVLEGDGRRKTIIQASDGGTFFQSTTFSLLAANFVARNITFKNIRDHKVDFIWAPAAVITGDKAAFFECGFISLQDTLTDNLGRHYFESCYIQGAVDFIWGDGQSIYQKCTINVTYELTRTSEVGYITAQARHSANSQSGFVFIRCIVLGTARRTYLGRAYTQYSRVLFYKSTLGQVITPEGWSAWSYIGREESIIFAEEGCNGPGAEIGKRVKWEKKLSPTEVKSLIDISFINQDGWLNKLPSPMQI